MYIIYKNNILCSLIYHMSICSFNTEGVIINRNEENLDKYIQAQGDEASQDNCNKIKTEQFYDYLYQLLGIVKELNMSQHIYFPTNPPKKRESCDNAVLSAVLAAKLSISKLRKIYTLIQNKKALNLKFFFNNQNSKLWPFIHEEVREFAKYLFKKTPKGFRTPNAAPGEGELMFCLLHPDIKKPVRGDICLNYEGDKIIFELKGKFPRVQTNQLGNEFRRKTLEIADKYGIQPNECRAQKVDLAVELEKSTYKDHYDKQLIKLSKEERKKFIWEWLLATKGIFNDKKKVLSNILEKDGYNQLNLQKEIVKSFFRFMCENNTFTSMIVFSEEGSKVKIVPNMPERFDEMIDKEIIKLDSDYFRVGQDYVLGWYFK